MKAAPAEFPFLFEQNEEQRASHLKKSEAQSFGRIENATPRMAKLIDDLLFYSDTSHRPRETEAIDLNEKLILVLERPGVRHRRKKCCL